LKIDDNSFAGAFQITASNFMMRHTALRDVIRGRSADAVDNMRAQR
jgi:hypothetical protein